MIDSKDVLSSSISLSRHPRKDEKRIYFLINGSEIVYIGQSKDPESRFYEHKCNGKDFDLVSVFNVSDVGMINEIEADLIATFNPKLNLRIHANKWVRKCNNKDPEVCFSRTVNKRKFCKDRMESFCVDEVVSHKYEAIPDKYTLYDKDGKAYHVNPKMVMEKNDNEKRT